LYFFWGGVGLFGMLSGEQKLTWQVAKSPSIKVWQVEQKKTVAKPTKKRKALYYSIENFSLRTQFFLDPSLWEFTYSCWPRFP
jgi:hypothetical protein